MNLKLKALQIGLKVIGWLKQFSSKIKAVFPQSRNTQMANEIKKLKEDLKDRETKLEQLTKPKTIEKIKTLEPKEQYEQIELYTATVNKGKKGSPDISAYLTINLPKSEMEKVKTKVYDIDTYKLKGALGIPQDKVVVDVQKGETASNIQTRFIDLNGKNINVESYKDVLKILKIGD